MGIYTYITQQDGDLFRGIKVVFVITRRTGIVDPGLNVGHRPTHGD